MNLLTTLYLFLVTRSALAYRNGDNRADDRRLRTRGVLQPSNRALKTGSGGDQGMSKKGMKGGMASSKGGMASSKGGNKGGSGGGCTTITIKAPFDEIEAGRFATAVGFTLTFPVYDYDSMEIIGTYTDSDTEIFVNGEFEDCTFTGSFNFDFDDSLDFPFVSQVSVAGTCLGNTNSITGGTGRYACASGFETFVDGGEDFFASELTICNTCA